MKIQQHSKPNIKIIYNGEYPNLCSGKLVVIIDTYEYKFPDYCLRSGGSVAFDNNWAEHVTQGEWQISDWPTNFPEILKQEITDAVNQQIPHGCCGGCV